MNAITSTSLLNQDLLDCDPQKSDLANLASQSATSVTVYFSLLQKNGLTLNFTQSCTGIGGILSQIIKVINTVLLADISCLRDQENGRNFFPIAHDVMVNQTIIQNNMSSPVWAHSLVVLCQAETLAQAMTDSVRNSDIRFYSQVAFGDYKGRGDYCDFDFLQTVAKAALYSRLRAIKHTGVLPATYLDDLRSRTERSRLTREAQSYLQSYPFSSLAQEGWLRTLLVEYWERGLSDSTPDAIFNSYLLIAETFLQEGMYRRAYGYLRRLKPVLDPLAEQAVTWHEMLSNSQPIASATVLKNFSGSLLIRYLLCWANYYYLLDPLDRSHPRYRGDLPNQADERSVIREAWDMINKAEKLVAVRLAKYLLINEISQGTFQPHYSLLAQIYFLRLRLLLFFPHLVPVDRVYLPTDVAGTGNRRDVNAVYGGWLYLLEKARLHAACSGEQELCSCYAAYQSYIYLMLSFQEQELRLAPGDREISISPTDCLPWARKLRNHAILSYAKTGRHCYYQIKEKSGISRSLSRSYGIYSVQEIPPIREIRYPDEDRPGSHDNGLLYIDMQLLSIARESCQDNVDHEPSEEKVYLFGTNACYALFARGLYHLCSDDRLEFETASPLRTAQEWDEKFSRSYRLFTYAEAMAEDGGTLQQYEADSTIQMGRDFAPPSPLSTDSIGTEESTAAHARSVRDLYPRRVTEIADLTKVFRAATAILRLYLGQEEVEQLSNDFAAPLSKLHQEHRCQQDITADRLKGQSRYNGHLEDFFERCRRGLEREYREVQPLENLADIRVYRKRILRVLFDGLHQQ